MIQIIETNLMLDDKLDNFQSRVIEVESWDYVISQFIQNDVKHPKIHYDIHGRQGLGNSHSLECGVE